MRQLKNKIEEVKKEKSIIEAGNETTGEKGLIQINNLIEKLKLERKGIESTIPLKKFWNPGTILSIVALSVLVLYLAIFFSSAIYKVLIEESRIMAQVMIGQAEMPKIINANAFYDIKNQEGWLFAIIAILFFTIPVLLSNLKLFVKDNKWAKYLGLLIGVLIFDVIVAFMVAKNTNHIRNLVTGEKNELNFWEVPLEGEFWLIFIFGMFPLIITHYVIDYLLNAYQKSQSEIVDADKTRKIRVIDQSILDLNSKKEILVSKLAEKDEILKQNSEHLDRLEKDLDFQINEVKNKYHEIFKNIKSIYDDFISRITSGRIFTEEIFKSVYIAYKTGFIEYLTELYSEKEVSNRTRVIEQQINHNF